MRTKKLISYSWDLEDLVTEEVKEQLKKSAEQRVFEMIKDGYTSGELFGYIEEEDQGVWGRWSVDRVIDDEKNTFIESTSEARFHINRLGDVFNDMPNKGDKEDESQKICLINALKNLEAVINGTVSTDFEQ